MKRRYDTKHCYTQNDDKLSILIVVMPRIVEFSVVMLSFILFSAVMLAVRVGSLPCLQILG